MMTYSQTVHKIKQFVVVGIPKKSGRAFHVVTAKNKCLKQALKRTCFLKKVFSFLAKICFFSP